MSVTDKLLASAVPAIIIERWTGNALWPPKREPPALGLAAQGQWRFGLVAGPPAAPNNHGGRLRAMATFWLCQRGTGFSRRGTKAEAGL